MELVPEEKLVVITTEKPINKMNKSKIADTSLKLS